MKNYTCGRNEALFVKCTQVQKISLRRLLAPLGPSPLSLSLSHTHMPTHSISLSLTLSLSHTHTHSLSQSLTHTNTHAHSLFCLLLSLVHLHLCAIITSLYVRLHSSFYSHASLSSFSLSLALSHCHVRVSKHCSMWVLSSQVCKKAKYFI